MMTACRKPHPLEMLIRLRSVTILALVASSVTVAIGAVTLTAASATQLLLPRKLARPARKAVFVLGGGWLLVTLASVLWDWRSTLAEAAGYDIAAGPPNDAL